MIRDEYVEHMHAVWMLLAMIDALPLDEMRAAQGNAETIGPFVDPTLFIRNAKPFAEDCAATKILADAQQAIRALKASSDGRRRQQRDHDHDRQADPAMRDRSDRPRRV